MVKIIRGVKRAEPGRAEPSGKYQHTSAATVSLRKHSGAQQSAAGTTIKKSHMANMHVCVYDTQLISLTPGRSCVLLSRVESYRSSFMWPVKPTPDKACT